MRLKFLLRPGWLALTAVVFAFATACFTVLAPWQFGEHEERKADNAALQNALGARPQPLEQAFPGEWTPVTITGQYLADDEVLARLRVVLGEPAFEVLTPLRTSRGDTVLVNRGVVRPDQRSGVPDYPPPPAGEVTVTARARNDERGSRPAERIGERVQVYGVGSGVVEKATGVALRPGYFQLSEGQPGVLEPLPLPRMEAGPFLSYALQWIAFGVMALLGWLYFTVRELRPGGVLHGDPNAQARPRKRKSVAEMLADDPV